MAGIFCRRVGVGVGVHSGANVGGVDAVHRSIVDCGCALVQLKVNVWLRVTRSVDLVSLEGSVCCFIAGGPDGVVARDYDLPV